MSTPQAHTRTSVDFVEEFAGTAEWFAVTLAGVDLRAPVPTCPGWSAYDLAVHLGNVHAWAATIVETGRAAPGQNDEPDHKKAKSVAEWYAAKAEDLYQVLRQAKPEAPCWNFAFGEGLTSFWPRRQLHEATMHGVDLALSARRLPDIPRAVAADGIDEALRVFLHRMHERGHGATLTASLSIKATDTEDSWTVRPADGRSPEVLTGMTAHTDLVEGPAAAVYALLWKRLPGSDSSLAFTGDQSRIDAFLGSRLTA